MPGYAPAMVDGVSRWEVDDYLPPSLRIDLEERLWRPIESRATLEALRDDPGFARQPGAHPAMFADHGVVHVRDVANTAVQLVDSIDGLLLPGRAPDRRRCVTAVAVATAYLHDIGMVDLTPGGRRVHPAYAAQAAFGPDVDPLVRHLLASGPVRDRLDRIMATAPFAVPLETIVREILSMTVAHSKTAVPAAVLDDRPRLRRLLQQVLFTGLDEQRAADRLPSGEVMPLRWEGPAAERHPDPSVSFAWIGAADGPHAELADDVIDAVRVLRAADVLRQRGTVLRTSGGFELCVDAETARAVCTMRSAGDEQAYVVIYDDDRGAGEANVRVAFLTPQGDLRIAFHRGRFGSDAAAERAATSVADVVIDIAGDVIGSLGGTHVAAGLRSPSRPIGDVRILLERPDDRPAFADDVAASVAARDPSLTSRLAVVADVEGAAPIERARYHAATHMVGTGPLAAEVVRRMQDRGADLRELDPDAAFAEVRQALVRRDEVLVERGSPPRFAYVPMGPGLVVRPGGGYPPAPLQPWLPVGTTGIIRRAERNAEVVAEREVPLLVIPAEVYARCWLRPLRVQELVDRLTAAAHTP
jgi:hypothetical protein